MADGTGIEWTDATWNVVLGCDRVSPGCDGCYAIRTARRMAGNPNPKVALPYAGLVDERDGRLDWTGQVNLVDDRLTLPMRWTKPRRIFVNAQSDLFHDQVPDQFIARVFGVMAATPRHTFQVLTKRHARMRSLLSSDTFSAAVSRQAVRYLAAFERPRVDLGKPWDVWPLPNLWLGVSVEDQKRAELRLPALLDTPAAVRWASCEPLLGPLELDWWLGGHWRCPTCGFDQGSHMGNTHCIECRTRSYPPPYRSLDWIVVGGESGPGARPMHPAWPRRLRDQCAAAGVPYLFKQWGEYGLLPRGWREEGPWPDEPGVTVADDGTVYQPGDLTYDPPGPRYGEAVRADHGRAQLTAMYRAGKKEAGRELDGRTWDQYPAVVTA